MSSTLGYVQYNNAVSIGLSFFKIRAVGEKLRQLSNRLGPGARGGHNCNQKRFFSFSNRERVCIAVGGGLAC